MLRKRNDHIVEYVQLGDQEIVASMLKSKDFDVNAPNDQGLLPLVEAAKRNDDPMVKILIAAGADATKKDSDELNALEWANIHGNAQMTLLLLNAMTDKTDSRPRRKL